jgi:hypothetical protein
MFKTNLQSCLTRLHSENYLNPKDILAELQKVLTDDNLRENEIGKRFC